MKENLTLHNYYEKWLEEDKRPFLSKSTLHNIETSFNLHILPKLANIKIKALSKSIIQNYLNAIPNSRTKEILILYFKACITQAYKERLIEYNPFDNIKTQKKIKNIKQALSAKEQERLLIKLKAENQTIYYAILLFLCLGCRRNELFTIESKNIKNDYVLIKGTKSNNATRYTKTTPKIIEIIKNKLPAIKQINIDYIGKTLTKTLKELKLKGSLHTLRHCFATNHFYLGTPAKEVQQWIGHSTIAMTLDIYTNLNPTIDRNEEKNQLKKLYNNLYYYSD